MTDPVTAAGHPADPAPPLRPGGAGSRSRRRRVVLATVALVALLSSAALGASLVRVSQSPATAFASARAPRPTAIAVRPTVGVLSRWSITRARVVDRGRVSVSVPTSSAADASAAITWLPQVGTTVAEGQRLMGIGGRPMILLRGLTPMYRDLRLGDAGDDVGELNDALRRLGLRPGGSQVVDGATVAGVQALFGRAGYVTAALPTDLADQLQSLDESIAAARRAAADLDSPSKVLAATVEAQRATATAQGAVDQAVTHRERVAAERDAKLAELAAQPDSQDVRDQIGDVTRQAGWDLADADAAVAAARSQLQQAAQDAQLAGLQRAEAEADARAEVDVQQADRDRKLAEWTGTIRATDVYFAPSAPLTVVSRVDLSGGAQRGGDEAPVTLTSSALSVTMDVADGSAVPAVGTPVQLQADGAAGSIDGRVASALIDASSVTSSSTGAPAAASTASSSSAAASSSAGGSGPSGSSVASPAASSAAAPPRQVMVQVDGSALSDGTSFTARYQVPVSSDRSLIVPESAVSIGSTGEGTVVVRRDGGWRSIRVQVIGVADGRVAVALGGALDDATDVRLGHGA